MSRYDYVVLILDDDGHLTGQLLNSGRTDAPAAGDLAWELAQELSHRADDHGYRVEVWQPGTRGEYDYEPAAVVTVNTRGRDLDPPGRGL